jgi:hypothetical protein
MLLRMNGGGGEGSDYGSSDEGSYEYDEEGEEDYEEELELSLVSAIVSTYDSLPQPQLNSQFSWLLVCNFGFLVQGEQWRWSTRTIMRMIHRL